MDESRNKSNNKADDEDTSQYPHGIRLFLIFLCLCISTLLVALDATIIATAIPTITSEFNSLSDVSWYNAAFLLTTSAFQIPYGRAYTLLSTKWTFFASILIFEVGSAVCGSAPASVALIIGRAIQGVGGAGVFGGAFIIISKSVELRKRALYAGSIGAMFAIASAVGPLLGGALTERVSWRWCFYINLPLGGAVLVVVALFMPSSVDQKSESLEGLSFWQAFERFDPIGTVLILGSIISLLLALQWGGLQYEWSDGRVITALTVFAVTFVIWVAVQWYEGEKATVPKDVIKNRTVAGATLYAILSSAAFTIVVYYLPTWFQAIRQDDAEQSGIHILPTILAVSISAIAGGGGVYVVGYFTPFLYLGTVLISVGAGLLYTFTPYVSTGTWIGYQIVFALGIGMSLEQCNVAIQAALPDKRIPAGTSLVVFARSLGGTISVSVAQSVFEKRLRENLASALPGLDPSVVSGSGATNLVQKVLELTGGSQEQLTEILELYNNAVVQTFLAALIFAALTLLPCLVIEWKSVKKSNNEKEKDVEKSIAENNEKKNIDEDDRVVSGNEKLKG